MFSKHFPQFWHWLELTCHHWPVTCDLRPVTCDLRFTLTGITVWTKQWWERENSRFNCRKKYLNLIGCTEIWCKRICLWSGVCISEVINCWTEVIHHAWHSGYLSGRHRISPAKSYRIYVAKSKKLFKNITEFRYFCHKIGWNLVLQELENLRNPVHDGKSFHFVR